MLILNKNRKDSVKEYFDMYEFKREEGIWYIHLPRHLRREWDQQILRMTEGAHKFLNVLSKGTKKLSLRISLQPQENAGVLELVEHCQAPKGGAIYLYTPVNEQSNSALFWICDLALFVFGDIPDRFYVQRR